VVYVCKFSVLKLNNYREEKKMKLLRHGDFGKEKPGIIDQEGKIRDLSDHITDINGDTINASSLKKIAAIDLSSLPTVSNTTRLGACVGNVGKFLCIGLNYSDHAAESGLPVPSEPILFSKATSAIVGPNDNVEIPRNSSETDWEVELGIIIGKKAKYINEDDAEDYIAGYCVVNDVSERAFQIKREGQWTKGKSCDTFGPTGPYLVTKDEIPDVQNLKMYLDVNGKRMQDGSTNTMIFSAKHIVYYLSQFMSLNPGDVIATGTPPGVGLGMKPPVFLNAGDTMKLGIEGLGEQNQTCIQG
jgi:ureidoglycolate lyase